MKKIIIVTASILAVILIWLVLTGFVPKKDVFVYDYYVTPDGDTMTIKVGVGSSMGYVRGYTDISDDLQKMTLRFYSSFGGLNSSLGAKNEYILKLCNECTEIYFERNDEAQLILRKNETTGDWERV